ncbi:hypothetical protein BDA96_08G132400 [Sorghum bicolor]|uniref:Cathepsin propeptide inhibitor domain-containing protein n=2 Tax=Sorghum bicolor TaxID=4558 RepID=A0A921QIF7_SORBI|nr:uncharacterized protein LOC8067251 [Sorghum bicolor]KAG0521106.1 hypothetical protein BDA96_08G132400 [Sorghum bicolor]KXG23620.1 hypothetical protein SORBI_3008G119000 [Sorghum bicolor]|eukprot:XP_021301335.1 uncharacterized protein LOC8067251 [Sorghum bicolor]
MAAAAAAIRAVTAVAGLSAAARHVASGLRQSARRGFVGDTAAFTRRPLLPHHATSGAHILRRGLAVVPGEGDDHSVGVGVEVSPVAPDPFDPCDPESPDDPETCFAYDDVDLESEETMWAMYERWCVFHGVKRDRDDMLRRFSLFKDRARSIHEFNKSGKPWTQGLNKFGDQTPEERSKLFPPRFSRPSSHQA